MAFSRGAPEVILALSERLHDGETAQPLTAADREKHHGASPPTGAKRPCACSPWRCASTAPDDPDPPHWEKALTFVALVGIVDPPPPEVKAAMDEARSRRHPLVNDHRRPPRRPRAPIAIEIGMFGEQDLVLTAVELDSMDDQSLAEPHREGDRHRAAPPRRTSCAS
jgi:Ca2+-transporting ATPase